MALYGTLTIIVKVVRHSLTIDHAYTKQLLRKEEQLVRKYTQLDWFQQQLETLRHELKTLLDKLETLQDNLPPRDSFGCLQHDSFGHLPRESISRLDIRSLLLILFISLSSSFADTPALP